MTVPLTVDDVQQILEMAIVAAKLAPTDVAPGLATTLAQATTSALNEIVTPATGPVLTTSIPVSVMSVTEALAVRDALSDVVGEYTLGSTVDDSVAEGLLLSGFVDVPKLLAVTRQPKTAAPVSAPTPVVTRSTGPTPRAMSQVTGSVPAS